MGRLRRSRTTKVDKELRKKFRTRRRTKDLDQIHDDLKPENAQKLAAQEVDADLPGLGQHYCIHCNRYFVDDKPLQEHLVSKVHKRRVKELKEAPYTQEEAERAAGLGTDRGKRSAPPVPMEDDEDS